jgi:transcription initiation factor TFIID subunit TAF12
MVFPVGIVFKGQGFYKTDSRSSSSGSIGPATAAAGNGTPAKTGDTAEAAKPAAKTETKATNSSKESTPSVATPTGGAAGGGGRDG